MLNIFLSFLLVVGFGVIAAWVLARADRKRARLAEAALVSERQAEMMARLTEEAVGDSERAALQDAKETTERTAEALANDLRRERDEWQRKYEDLHRSLVAVDPAPAAADGILLRLCDRRGRLRSEVHVHHRTPEIPKHYVYAGVTYRFARERAAGVFEFTEESTR